ncbi:MAG: hypothetical protein AB8B57_07860 [Congregibacter sp.]
MLRFREQSVSLQLALIGAASALLVGLCVLWLATRSSAYLQLEREQLYGESLAQQIAVSLSDPLQRGDLLSARASLQRFVDSSLAVAVEVRDIEGMPMGAAGSRDAVTGRQHEADILIGDDVAGRVFVSLDNRVDQENRWRFLFSLIALVAALSLLVFLTSRALAQRLSARLIAVNSQLQLHDGDTHSSLDHPVHNELDALQQSVERLPLEMLRGHAAVPVAATDFYQGSIIFVHLVSLVRYVETLSENNLHRYSRRVQQIIQAAAQCYRGEFSVTRPFGLLISFSPQASAGSEALRAASCARLIALVAQGLEARTSLSLEFAMAMGPCEQGVEGVDDIYPQLHLHGAIDELREICLHHTEFPAISLAQELLNDPQLGESASCADVDTLSSGDTIGVTADTNTGFLELRALSQEQETLLAHQASIIVERIKPQA